MATPLIKRLLTPTFIIALTIFTGTSILLYEGKIPLPLYTWVLGALLGYYFGISRKPANPQS